MTYQEEEYITLLPKNLCVKDKNDLDPREKAFLEIIKRRDERMDDLHRMILDE